LTKEVDMNSAMWSIALPFSFRVGAVNADQDLSVRGQCEGLAYAIRVPQPDLSASFVKTGEITIWPCRRIQIEITYHESPDSTGGPIEKWEERERLQSVALNVLNSFLRAVRYLTRQLHVQTLTETEFMSCADPVFTDEGGESSVFLYANTGWPCLMVLDPAEASSPINHSEIESVVANPESMDTTQSLLYDAFGFLETGDVRRAVLEAAIAAEILIKQHISRKGGPIYEFIVEEHGLSFSVTTLFDKVLSCLGECSLKSEDPHRYNTLDYLFRTRNQIAHTGKCGFRHNSKWNLVGREKATEFLEVVKWVFGWLEGIDVPNQAGILRFN
jgi:hypothetical protein